MSAPWVLWTNVAITRRKSFHLVEDPQGNIVYRNAKFWPCVEYLDSVEIRRYELRPSEPPTNASVEVVTVSKGSM